MIEMAREVLWGIGGAFQGDANTCARECGVCLRRMTLTTTSLVCFLEVT